MENIRNTKTFAYIIIASGAILYTIGIQAFLQVVRIFPTGLGAFVTIITYSNKFLESYFSLIYLAFNIPFIFFFWKKIKKQFIYKTTFFLLVQAAIGSLFMIHSLGDPMRSIFDTFKPFRENNSSGKASGWPIIIMSAISALFSGFGIALSWKYGGSSGGADIITYYYSTKKQKSIGKIALIVGIIIALFSFGIILALDNDMRSLWYLTLISTFLYVILISWIIDWFFPKYSKVKISIHSNKNKEIHKYLLESKFPHAFYFKDIESGYSGDKKRVIESVLLLLEVRILIKALLEIDPEIWISVEEIRNVKGRFVTKNVD